MRYEAEPTGLQAEADDIVTLWMMQETGRTMHVTGRMMHVTERMMHETERTWG